MPFSHVDAAPRWFAPNAVTDALLAAILEGERLCRDYPELEEPDPAPAALRLAFGEVGDPARILHGVALHLGRSPVYGWCGDERLLLASLGQLFASLPAASRGPVVVAAAARLWRLASYVIDAGGGVKTRIRPALPSRPPKRT